MMSHELLGLNVRIELVSISGSISDVWESRKPQRESSTVVSASNDEIIFIK